jgi:CheY-like chemotaxis protein
MPALQLAAPRAQIIIVSAYADRTSAQEALNQGARGVLWKPFRIPAFLEMIRRVVGQVH